MVIINETVKIFKTRDTDYGFYNTYLRKWERISDHQPSAISIQVHFNKEEIECLKNALASVYQTHSKHSSNYYQPALNLVEMICRGEYSNLTTHEALKNYVPDTTAIINKQVSESQVETSQTVDDNQTSIQRPVSEILDEFIDFFKEFDFLPNFRFMSMVNQFAKKSVNKVREYVKNYFEISDKLETPELTEKLKSFEFENMCNELAQHDCKTINHRLKIFYGPQGTGKTTLASKEAKDIIVCHSGMLPADLMEDFEFDDGKAGFHKSLLWKAMENGTPVVLDEINLLQLDSLRFLQGLLDEKETINYKGQEIHIKDGFYIIGTMNLEVNGCVYALPEPLVDRCSEIMKFNLTGKQLAMAFN